MSEPSSADLGREFVALIHAFGVLRTDATPCGQPMSVSTAHALSELAAQGALGQKELAQTLGLESSSVSRLVDQLVRRGWARRTLDPESTDRRARLVQLTQQGLETAELVLAARAERFMQLFERVDESQRSQVLESLHLLREAAHDLR